MSHYAKVVDSKVISVIVAEEDFFDSFVDDSPGTWIQTSYTGSIRKNYAAIGFTYDLTRDAFIEPQPYTSWVLNETTCKYEAPVTYPDDGKGYRWNEETTNWTEIE